MMLTLTCRGVIELEHPFGTCRYTFFDHWGTTDYARFSLYDFVDQFRYHDVVQVQFKPGSGLYYVGVTNRGHIYRYAFRTDFESEMLVLESGTPNLFPPKTVLDWNVKII